MKKYLVIIVSVLLSLLSYFLLSSQTDLFYFISLPFIGFRKGLRFLSLSGVFGNLLSWMILVVVALIPITLTLCLHKKRSFKKYVLIFNAIFSFALGFILYFVVNVGILYDRLYPVLLGDTTNASGYITILLNALGMCVMIFLMIDFILWMISTNHKKEILNGLIDLFIFILVYVLINVHMELILSSANSYQTEMDQFLGIFDFLVYLISYGLLIFILMSIKDCLTNFEVEQTSKIFLTKLKKLSNIAILYLLLSILLTLIRFIILFFGLSSISHVNFTLSIPIDFMFLVLLIYLISSYFERVYDLEQDHSMII